MEEKAEDKHDPGWNDPPIFTYDKAKAIQASAARKGTLLNKRVAYPMTGKSAVASPTPLMTPPLNVPQMTAPPTNIPPPIQSTGYDARTDEMRKATKIERLNKVMKSFEQLIPESDAEEINKRIKVMEKMWIDDKLDEHVQLKLIDLTEALHEGNIELADHLQKGLMVDYVSQCSSWMSGIRQLINSKRNSTGS